MSKDIIPLNDDEFDKFQKQFLGAVAPAPDKFGIPQADLTQLQAEQAAWNQAFPAHVNAKAAALAASQAKDVAKGKLVKGLRGAAKKVNGTPGVDDALRAQAGMQPHQTRTPIGAPATHPLGRLEPKGHTTLALHVADESTPLRAAKPKGVHGCEIWRHVGDPQPPDVNGYVYAGTTTRTPFTDVFTAADAGKTAYYLLRWTSTKGQAGPWSDVVAAKIPL
jgi:hypothetical protein